MTRPRLLSLCLLTSALLSACVSEPRYGCTLACANERQILRAHAYLHPTIPARILHVTFAGQPMGHALLVFRLDHGWHYYDDACGTSALSVPPGWQGFPPPLTVARLACPHQAVAEAHWID